MAAAMADPELAAGPPARPPAGAWKAAVAKVQQQQEQNGARRSDAGSGGGGGGVSFFLEDHNPLSLIEQRHSQPPVVEPPTPRLAVVVHSAVNLPGGAGRGGGPQQQPRAQNIYAKVSVHRPGHLPLPADKRKTHAVRQVDDTASWGSLLSLCPQHPEEMEVTLVLKHKQPLLNKSVAWGSISVRLADILADPGPWGERRMLPLRGHKVEAEGTLLEVQLFLATERLEGPLSVLAATWNVGNAEPPADLQEWLRGASGGEAQHHLVVVGAQECNYGKDARVRRKASTRHSAAVPSAAEPAAKGGASAAEPHNGAESDDSDDESTTGGGGGGAASSPRASSSAEAAAGKAQPAAAANDSGGGGGSRQYVSTHGKSRASRLASLLLDQVDSSSAWERHISAALGSRYWLVAARNMLQTRILVFGRVDVMPHLSGIATGFEATGIGHVGLNKGGTAAWLRLGDTHLAFVSAHLAAHQGKTAQRNSDVAEILSNMRLGGGGGGGGGGGARSANVRGSPAAPGADLATGFHHVVWMGDLNYRLQYGQQATTQAESPLPEDFASLCAAIEQGQYAELLELDQLRIEQAAGRVLVGFHEGEIGFAPTFKVKKGEPGPSYTPKRSPAWCDRVLARSALPHKAVGFGSYFSAPSICTSDHKPVAAVLTLPLVTDTVASAGGRGRGHAPFKLYVSSAQLDGAESWEALLQLLLAPGGVGGGGGAGSRGAALRRRRLQLVLSGTCLGAPRQEHMLRVDQEVVVAGLQAAASGGDAGAAALRASLVPREESTAMLPGGVQDLNDDWLLLRLVLVDGLKRRTLARGVVPLQPAVAAYQSRNFRPVAVPVQLEASGAAAGTAVLGLQLISSHSARQGMYEAIRRMRLLALVHGGSSGGGVGSSGGGGDRSSSSGGGGAAARGRTLSGTAAPKGLGMRMRERLRPLMSSWASMSGVGQRHKSV